MPSSSDKKQSDAKSRGKGHSKADDQVSENIEKIVHDWEQDGSIGNSHPATKKKAIKQAVAISLKKAGKSKYQKKGARH